MDVIWRHSDVIIISFENNQNINEKLLTLTLSKSLLSAINFLYLNLFLVNAAILYPLKITKILWFFRSFQGVM